MELNMELNMEPYDSVRKSHKCINSYKSVQNIIQTQIFIPIKSFRVIKML